MGKKAHRKKILTLNKRIHDHELKIRKELAQAAPNHGRIEHWMTEIRGFKLGIAKAKRRLV